MVLRIVRYSLSPLSRIITCRKEIRWDVHMRHLKMEKKRKKKLKERIDLQKKRLSWLSMLDSISLKMYTVVDTSEEGYWIVKRSEREREKEKERKREKIKSSVYDFPCNLTEYFSLRYTEWKGDTKNERFKGIIGKKKIRSKKFK